MAARIGLIGAGLLGSALAERFDAFDYKVEAYDTVPGRGTVPTIADAVRGADFVVLCLPDSHIAASVVGQLALLLQPHQLVIDTTTGEPTEMEANAQRLARYVDATVAGSSQVVREGQAVVTAGGTNVDIAAAHPLLATFAARIFHAGPCGAGARMKLVVNLALGLQRAVLAEALAFAEATGVDPALALDVLRAGPAYSRAMDHKGARMLERRWDKPDARLRQHHKDVRLILAEAAAHGLALPLSELHHRLLDQAEAAGFADADNSAIYEVFLRREPQP
ncbi:MAG: NAD(P)-dependent oxidoreductase [Bryobacterales bacterium]|nr:NAD(P)-dependent oxidoreductase [Bryobacterales bacterium]